MQQYGSRDIAEGMKVEQEHKDVTHGDPIMIKKIVMAHLKERPDYYVKLKKMEKSPRVKSYGATYDNKSVILAKGMKT